VSTPRISICIPAYQAERYLPDALASVRRQSFADWELIVTEDGSRDSTEAIVRAFADTGPQPVRYERHADNRGLPATRNTGIAGARADWIALLDADDLWNPGHLQSLATTAAQTPAGLVHAGSVLFESDTGRPLEERAPAATAIAEFPRSLFNGTYLIQPSSVLLSRSLWERVGGFDPSFRYVEDREMWIRCARAGARFAYTGTSTCRYRRHAAALSRHGPAMALACAQLFEKNLDWEGVPRRLRRAQAAAAWLAAGRIALRIDPRAAREYFGRALRHRAFAPAAVGFWLAALFLSRTRGKPA
jgi:GT2 family glycosyltransferase